MVEIEEMRAAALEARVALWAVVELAEALRAKGALERHDIAAALLRVVETARTVAMEEGGLMKAAPEAADLAIAHADGRLGLRPDLYWLRAEAAKWRRAGGQGPAPISPAGLATLLGRKPPPP